ncbi:TonB family protein [Dechloromonas agitata]|uniref:TonB family protein n=1 Tax=Dechloromonas agitata TaxID=73030 RepID=UPI00237D59BF|nr:TonB family protein [Dechloromonas agitata]MDE1546610.1 TonB family protein [Dechloromonas agitata]
MDTEIKPPRRWLNIVVIVVAGAAVIALVIWGIMSLMGEKSGKPRKPPTVTLLPDKPPPPPPPPKEEKKPEPPKEEKQEMKVAPPKEQVQAQNEPLKMEGMAGEGGSPFSAGTVGRDYAGGAIGGTGSALQSMFSARLQRHLQDQLNRSRKLREADYRIAVRLWLRRDGSVERVELTQSTGNEALDEQLREAILQTGAMREPPPDNLSMPLRIRVTARGAA